VKRKIQYIIVMGILIFL